MDPVKLIASDGTEVILDRRAAMVSGTIKAMLAGPGAGAAPSLLLSRRGLTLLCQPRRQFHRGAAGRDQVPGDLGAHPREGPLTHAFLRERPFGHRQLLSFPLAPAIAPTLGPPPSPASLLSALPQSLRAPGAASHLLAPLWQTVQYFYYKLRYTNHQGTLPEFKIEPENALELLMAANYLDT